MTTDSYGFETVGVGEHGARTSRRMCLEKLSVVLRSLGSDKTPVWHDDEEARKWSSPRSVNDIWLDMFKVFFGRGTEFEGPPLWEIYYTLGTRTLDYADAFRLLSSWLCQKGNQGDISEGFGAIVEIVSHGLFGRAAAGAAAAEVLVSPDQRFLLVSSRFDHIDGRGNDDDDDDDDVIATFEINQGTGTLDTPAFAAAGGKNPRSMRLSKDGARLAVALQTDGQVVVLARDGQVIVLARDVQVIVLARDVQVIVLARDVQDGSLGRELARVSTAAEPVAAVWGLVEYSTWRTLSCTQVLHDNGLNRVL